jgi:hypothetical protein
LCTFGKAARERSEGGKLGRRAEDRQKRRFGRKVPTRSVRTPSPKLRAEIFILQVVGLH